MKGLVSILAIVAVALFATVAMQPSTADAQCHGGYARVSGFSSSYIAPSYVAPSVVVFQSNPFPLQSQYATSTVCDQFGNCATTTNVSAGFVRVFAGYDIYGRPTYALRRTAFGSFGGY